MKRFRLCLVACIVCVASHTVAQVQFGVKGGLNAANVKFDDADTEFILKFNVGALTRIALGEKFYIQPEVLFSQKGFEIEVNALDEDGDFTLNYFSVPLLVGYKVNKLSFYLGPELDFKLGTYANGDKLDHDPFESFDIGAAVGASYNINSKIGIDLRYVHGFKDILIVHLRDVNNMPLGEFRDGQHRLIQLGVFYFFNTKKN